MRRVSGETLATRARPPTSALPRQSRCSWVSWPCLTAHLALCRGSRWSGRQLPRLPHRAAQPGSGREAAGHSAARRAIRSPRRCSRHILIDSFVCAGSPQAARPLKTVQTESAARVERAAASAGCCPRRMRANKNMAGTRALITLALAVLGERVGSRPPDRGSCRGPLGLTRAPNDDQHPNIIPHPAHRASPRCSAP